MAQIPIFQPIGFSYKNINTSTTTIVKATPGTIRGLYINSATSTATVTIYDNATVASGTKIATLTLGTVTAPQRSTLDNINFANGLTIVTATAAVDLTVIYS